MLKKLGRGSKESRGLAIVLAGGRSQRLFPETRPKPLLTVKGRSLLELTLERLAGIPYLIVAKADIASAIRKEFRRRGRKAPPILGEPEARDTAAAVGFALRELTGTSVSRANSGRELRPAWIAVFSADQYFPSKPSFEKFLRQVKSEIQRHPSSLFVAGSPANAHKPEDYRRFGWIVAQSNKSKEIQRSAVVTEFVEKPQSARLKKLLKKKAFINSGMFFGSVDAFMQAYRAHYPRVLSRQTPYRQLPRQPIDRAIFERYSDVRMFRLPFVWRDLGTWKDWAEIEGLRPGENYVRRNSQLKIHTYGIANLAVIQRNDELLIMPLSKTPQMKKYLSHE